MTDLFAKKIFFWPQSITHSENYIHGMCLELMESFNNSLNIFHDKRVGSLSLQNYSLKTNLAIIHWNENVKSGKKVVTHRYHSNILNRLLSQKSPCLHSIEPLCKHFGFRWETEYRLVSNGSNLFDTLFVVSKGFESKTCFRNVTDENLRWGKNV